MILTWEPILFIAKRRKRTAFGLIWPPDPFSSVRVYGCTHPLRVNDCGAMANVKSFTYFVQSPAVTVRGKAGKCDKQLKVNRALLGGAQN